MKNQYVTDSHGEKIAVILPIKDYKKMMEELEDLEDIKLYDEAKSEKGKSIAFDTYLKQRKAKK